MKIGKIGKIRIRKYLRRPWTEVSKWYRYHITFSFFAMSEIVSYSLLCFSLQWSSKKARSALYYRLQKVVKNTVVLLPFYEPCIRQEFLLRLSFSEMIRIWMQWKKIYPRNHRAKKVFQSGSYKRQCSRHIINTKIRPPFYGAEIQSRNAGKLSSHSRLLAS